MTTDRVAIFSDIELEPPGKCSKWAKLMKCSQDTASRDIKDLVICGVLRRSSITYGVSDRRL